MGMLVDGIWRSDEDRSMQSGAYRREPSKLDAVNVDDVAAQINYAPARFTLVASLSCPWSHGTLVARCLMKLVDRIAVQVAGGPRVEGYALVSTGPLARELNVRHVHELYTRTVTDYTGRSTVPLLWDRERGCIVSNASGDIIAIFDRLSNQTRLRPTHLSADIADLTKWIFENLSNAVYRAGKAQHQVEYEDAVTLVFESMDDLESRLQDKRFLYGDTITEADVRLFATLVRFDTVYATHFRCTLRRLTDYPNLWRYTREIYQLPGLADTVDFDEIRRGYYINDGDHNPYGLVGMQPVIDWWQPIPA